MAAHFSRAGRGCFGQRTFRALGGELLAAHFSQAGRGCFWQRIFRELIGSCLQCLALFLYLPSGGMVSLYAVSLVFGLSQGGIVPSYALVVREYMPAKEAGARVGFVMMATILGMALGGWLSGLTYDLSGSYTLAFLNGIIWNGANIAVIIWLILRSRASMSASAAA